MDKLNLTRRGSLGMGMAMAGAAAVSSRALAKTPSPNAVPFRTKIDFKDPIWNRDTYARLEGDLDIGKEKCGWFKGHAMGVRPNEAVRTLCGFEGFSFVRLQHLPDGSFRKLLREIVFYTDLETGEVLEHWDNPYTGERVRVVTAGNDPFNFTISQYAPEGPSYGGLRDATATRKPFLMNWEYGPNGTLILRTGIDMMYRNALQPDKWVRESSGVMNRVSEHFILVMEQADVENPNMTNIPRFGSWSRITPWFPWMLMGQAEGHINCFTASQTIPNGVEGLPAHLVAAARAMDEKWLSAPLTDYGPSLSSLENYAREQKPAPVPAGWTPPVPPAAPKA